MSNSKALMILLPDVSSSVTIAAEWFEQRDAMVARAAAIVAVATPADADAAGEAIRALSKSAAALEKQRTAITAPFLKAQKLIKAKADEATAPLVAEKARLEGLVGQHVAAERRRQEEEERAAEAERRDKIQAQVDQQAAEAELFGDAPSAAPVEVVVPEAAPVQRSAPVSGVRVEEVLAFEVVNPDEVPRRFLVVDESAIRRELAANKDAFIKRLKDDPACGLIPGVAVKIDVRVGSR